MDIQKLLLIVLENYLTGKKDHKQVSKNTLHYEYLSKHIPNYFKNLIEKNSNFSEKYTIKSSQGMGNWAEIPWVVFMNRDITTSAQEGYYIVLGFSADMKSCYLSLNQGVSKTDKNNLSQFAHVAIQYTKPSIDDNVVFGKIDFKAKNSLGKSYEKSAIKSYKYSLDDLKSYSLDSKITNQFNELLKDYENIFNLIGNNILQLQPTKDCFYQEQLQQIDNDLIEGELDKQSPKPSKSLKHFKYYTRNPRFSKIALKKANYKCEIDPTHETFSNGIHQYMEGHHLVPMSFQENYEHSLDIPSNIISVCPNCHRALHYGDNSIKIKFIGQIFKSRKVLLEKNGIVIDKKTLQNIYTKNQIDHEYD
jgi:5-methylcytosine-specific restriction enzyme A